MSRVPQAGYGPIALGLVLIVVLLVWVLPSYYTGLLTQIGLYALVTIGLNLFMGYAGQVSLGQAAFVGIGAYASAALAVKGHVTPWLGMIAGALVAALVAYVLSFIALRLRENLLALATLALGIVINVVFNEWEFIGGSSGFKDIPGFAIGTFAFDQRAYAVLAWALVALGIWFAGNVVRSTFGRTLIAISAGELGAQALAVDSDRLKRQTFVLSAVYAGVAGADHRAPQAADPADHRHQHEVHREQEAERGRVDVAERGGVDGARDAGVHRAQHERLPLQPVGVDGQRLRAQLAGRDRDQRAAERRAHDVPSEPDPERDQRPREDGVRALIERERPDREARDVLEPRRAADELPLVEHDVDDDAERERREREQILTQPQRDEAQHVRNQRCDERARDHAEPRRDVSLHRERRRRVRADPDERGLPQRDLSRIPHEQVEPDRDERVQPDLRQQPRIVGRQNPNEHDDDQHQAEGDRAVTRLRNA